MMETKFLRLSGLTREPNFHPPQENLSPSFSSRRRLSTETLGLNPPPARPRILLLLCYAPLPFSPPLLLLPRIGHILPAKVVRCCPDTKGCIFVCEFSLLVIKSNSKYFFQMTSVVESANSNIDQAEEFKLLANAAFKANKFSQAIDLYSQAIELNGLNAVYWANRALAHTKLEEYGSAVQDATKAIEIDPRYSKGYYRRGTAYLAMGKFKQALKDFQQVKRICPNDPDATRKLKECEKAVQKLRFEEAIAVHESERCSVAESIDFRTIEVDPQYIGARIEGEVVTLEFVKKMMDDFRNQKYLHKRYAYQIVLQARETLRAMPSLVDITVPNGHHFTVCGDVHGQFYDLLNIFELNGLPSNENPYLFNGDFVDRGSFSVEVILTLFAFKCMSPTAMHLSRGNHESKNMNKIYGFEGEVRSKLSDAFVELFAEVFCCLPLAHVINDKIFVVHGGLFSVDGVKLSDIRAIDRFCEPPEEDALGIPMQMGNKGAFIRFTAPDLKPDIVSFSAVPHPDVKPMAYANSFLRMFS
ncbi:hypothetical protein Cni_G21164 [Canna indica]|uniref:protein-serine/threonine phosphatase n=1 Tax=Canna indica TaxID=4628 RepID=A0AAQ3KRN3_9LILI|nr:hypothetical protein Cni_G21164 [Canna indica]